MGRGYRWDQLGSSNDFPTIWEVIEWVEGKQCDAARLCEPCGHKGCDTERRLITALTAHACDDPPTNHITTTTMHRWARVQVCRVRQGGGRCNHRACCDNQRMIDWLLSFTLPLSVEKAA